MANNQERVHAAMTLLREGLAPFVARELQKIFREPDRLRDLPIDPKLKSKQTRIDGLDVLALLKVMEATWRDVFGKTLGRIERGCVIELRVWRNKWAHQGGFRRMMRNVRWTRRNGFSSPSMRRRRTKWAGSGANCEPGT